MRIRETGTLSPEYIERAMEGHAKKVAKEFKAGVGTEHRLAHVARMSHLAQVAADRVLVSDERRARFHEARVS